MSEEVCYYSKGFDLKFAFGSEKLPVFSRNRRLAMKFAFSVFLSFYGFCGFYSRSSECASRFKLFFPLESFKTKNDLLRTFLFLIHTIFLM